jgi:hypothetical protein
MTTKLMKQVFSTLACSTLLVAGTAEAVAQLAPATPQPLPSNQPAMANPTPPPATPPAPEPETPEQLDSLVAPIALYPDALVAQVLAASAYPEQVAYAADWLAQNKNLTGSSLSQAVEEQSWDPSVKALTQFSSVMDNLAHNLAWSSRLGQAFTNQQADVMAAVQTMRSRAQAAGTLQSSSQITVEQQNPSTIVIKPANPTVVYVPQYNPAIVYGAPVAVPWYVPPPLPVVTSGIYFGAGIGIGAVIGGGWGGGWGWGWHAWNVNWGGGGGNVIFNNNTYINRTVINQNTYNGYHPWGPNNGTGYHPGVDTHYGPNGAYHPNGYYGPNGGWHPDGSVNHAGGATGSENRGYYGANGTYHPDPGYHPGVDTHYGPNGGYHPNGYFGPNGGFHADTAGTNPRSQPNGGNNGDHGLIGSNSGVQRVSAEYGGQRNSSLRQQPNNFGRVNQPRSYMSGDGNRARAESSRGWGSMRSQRMSAPHNFGGGRRR